jgi:hypothetical protein
MFREWRFETVQGSFIDQLEALNCVRAEPPGKASFRDGKI